MDKNIFDILNSSSKIWVDIFKLKYMNWHPWNFGKTNSSSWFFKSTCCSTDFIKLHYRILITNPSYLSLMNDPWLLDLPISHKPTFLNMEI